MHKSAIVSMATLCGLAAFLWTLVRWAPHPPRSQEPPPAAAASARQLRTELPPPALQDLEHDAAGSTDILVWFQLAQRRQAAGKGDAEEAWRKVVELAPTWIAQRPNWGFPWFAKGWALDKLADEPGALEAFAKAAPLLETRLASARPDLWRVAVQLAWVRHRLGHEDEARKLWTAESEELERMTHLEADSAYRLARAKALLGDADQAIESLLMAAERGFSDAQWAAGDDYLASVRADPRFEVALKKMREQGERRDTGE